MTVNLNNMFSGLILLKKGSTFLVHYEEGSTNVLLKLGKRHAISPSSHPPPPSPRLYKKTRTNYSSKISSSTIRKKFKRILLTRTIPLCSSLSLFNIDNKWYYQPEISLKLIVFTRMKIKKNLSNFF